MAGADKSEKATPKRFKQARKDGQLGHSHELGTWSLLFAFTYMLPWVVGRGQEMILSLMHRANLMIADPTITSAAQLLHDGIVDTGMLAAPIALLAPVVVIIASVAQGGFHISWKSAKPQPKRINPKSGIKRMFSSTTIWMTALSLIKLLVVGFVVYKVVVGWAPLLVGAGRVPWQVVVSQTAQAVMTVVRMACLAGLVLAVADAVWTVRKGRKGIKMTKQEVREEFRQSDGDPLLKGEVRARMRRMSRNRMMSAIATADVVVVNPIHVAVALRYREGMAAPEVVAKGKGALALKIKERATENRVPIIEDIGLARALEAACEIGQSVPPLLFTAVARVLAFVMTLKRRGASGLGVYRLPGGPTMPVPARTAEHQPSG